MFLHHSQFSVIPVLLSHRRPISLYSSLLACYSVLCWGKGGCVLRFCWIGFSCKFTWCSWSLGSTLSRCLCLHPHGSQILLCISWHGLGQEFPASPIVLDLWFVLMQEPTPEWPSCLFSRDRWLLLISFI